MTALLVAITMATPVLIGGTAAVAMSDPRIAGSGTPVENHTGELYSLMAFVAFVAPGLLG